MAIDASIPLQLRQSESPNLLAQYGQVMGIQNAQNQNALAQYTLAKAQRDDRTQTTLDQAYTGALGPDGKIDSTKLFASIAQGGAGSRLPEIQQKFMAMDKAEQEATKVQLENAKHRAERLSAALAPLVQKGASVSHDDVLSAIAPLEADGTLPPGAKARIPMNAMQLPQFVQHEAMQAEGGRKAIEMILPKIHMQDTGGTVQALNTNPLAGPIGPLVGVTPLAKTNTPGEILTDERTRSEGAANRGVTLRGQNLTDARAKETLNAGRWTNDLERGLQVNSATGETRPITKDGSPLGQRDKPLTESQGKALGLGMRAAEADRILNDLEKKGVMNTGITRSVVSGTVGALPLVGGRLSEGVSSGMNTLPGALGGPSSEQQMTDQARRNFVNAVLRVESGAMISQSEFENASKQYFPQPGDSKATIQQKQANRRQAIEALGAQAGSGEPRVTQPKKVKSPSEMTDAELKAALGMK